MVDSGRGIDRIVVTPGPEVLDFQARLIEALKPWTESGGTADAFVRSEAEPDINDDTLRSGEGYVPEHMGSS